MIDVTCPQCGEIYHSDAIHLGKRIRCTKCGFLLPILGDGSAILRKPLEASGVRRPRSQFEHRTARPSRRRNAFGFAFVAAVIAVGLLILWLYAMPHGSTTLDRSGADVSQSSSESRRAVREPSMHPDRLPVIGSEPMRIGPESPPCDEQKSYRSMPNGSRIMPDAGARGYGVLEVQNGTSEDAVLSLYDPAADETVREAYVQAKHSFRMKGVPMGTYELAYTTGLDWDTDGEIFRCGDPDYAQFERRFAFTEERDQEGIQYKTITVTLHPVIGGNVRTKRISREEFLKANHRAASLPDER